MAGQIVDLDAVRELRRLVARLEAPCCDVELVRAVGQAAWRAGDRRWITWAARSFDEVHDRVCSCRRRA